MSRKCFVHLFAGVLLLILLLSMAGCNTNQVQETAEADQRYDAPEPIPETKDEPQPVVEDTPEFETPEKQQSSKENTVSSEENTSKSLTFDDAFAIANEFGCSYYGDCFKAFVYEDHEQYNLTGWTFRYSSKYGENGFIAGPSVYINVDLDGNAKLSSQTTEDYSDFDISLLEGLSEEMVLEEGTAYFTAFEDRLSDYNQSKIHITYENDRYVLKYSVHAHLRNEDGCVVKEFYYEIEND